MRKGVPLIVANLGPATFGRDDNSAACWSTPTATARTAAAPTSSTLARQLVAEIAARLDALGTPAADAA